MNGIKTTFLKPCLKRSGRMRIWDRKTNTLSWHLSMKNEGLVSHLSSVLLRCGKHYSHNFSSPLQSAQLIAETQPAEEQYLLAPTRNMSLPKSNRTTELTKTSRRAMSLPPRGLKNNVYKKIKITQTL